jgi:hypothetical protein
MCFVVFCVVGYLFRLALRQSKYTESQRLAVMIAQPPIRRKRLKRTYAAYSKAFMDSVVIGLSVDSCLNTGYKRKLVRFTDDCLCPSVSETITAIDADLHLRKHLDVWTKG